MFKKINKEAKKNTTHQVVAISHHNASKDTDKLVMFKVTGIKLPF